MKKEAILLTQEQKHLVEQHLSVVSDAIRNHITVNETIFGFEYDDLFQEGCVWLCKAAASFQADRGFKFETYALPVVANGLRSYCRIMCNKQKRQITLPIRGDDSVSFSMETILTVTDSLPLDEFDVLDVLNALKQQYQGTVKLGIEAIEWKVRGFTGKEIADMYGVKPNLVGAWISRASDRLRKNSAFMKSVGRDVKGIAS